jgi:hypothetical protein
MSPHAMTIRRTPLHGPLLGLLLGLLGLLMLLCAGCAGMDAGGGPTRAGQHGPTGHDDVRQAAATLLEGVRLYENGNFKEAIAVLSEPDIQAAPDAIRVDALKYTAFSYCVTDNYTQCRHAFDLAFAIDSGFALHRNERGHPMWGPVYEQAKAANEQDHAHASLDQERERWRGVDLWRAR